ncbi:MAG: ABC transporter substrate-binding protein [Bacillota bacterium]
MKKFKCIVYVLMVVFITTMTLTSCAPATGDEDPEVSAPAEKVLVMGFEQDAETLDHIKTAWYSDALVYIFEQLVDMDYDNQYQPGLAESWDVSEDGLTWTFYLREGVKFHNGEPLTAEDVKWTFDTILDPDTAAPFAGDLAAIEEINVIDELTVAFVLGYPFPNLLFNLSMTPAGITWQGIYDEYGDDYGVRHVIGTGPYMLDEWIRGDKTVLVKNPDYNWNPEWMNHSGPALIDKVILRILPEETSRLMELETGGIHILRNITASIYEQVKDNDEIDVVQKESFRLGYLAYATDKDPFTDVRIRRAINHAVNREDIVEYIFRGLATAEYGYLPPSIASEYYEDSKKDGYEYNPERAMELLEEAGYPDGLELTLSADNSTESTRLAEVLQAQLGEVGINVTVRLYDSSSYADMLKEGEQELFIRLYGWSNADILDWFLHSSRFPFPNHSRWQDETTDMLIDKAGRMPTWDERSEAYIELQKYLIEQAVWCPIYVPQTLIAVREEVKNFNATAFHPQVGDGMDLVFE